MWWERWLVKDVGRRGGGGGGRGRGAEVGGACDGREENKIEQIQLLLKTDGRENGVAARRCGWKGSERRQHPNNDMSGARGWKPETRKGEARQRKIGAVRGRVNGRTKADVVEGEER